MIDDVDLDSAPQRITRGGRVFLRPSFLIAIVTWSLLVIAVVFARTMMVPLWQDFDVELPRVTQLLVRPMTAFVFAAVVGLAIILEAAIRSSVTKGRLFICLTIVGIGTAFISAFALIVPLIALVDQLN